MCGIAGIVNFKGNKGRLKAIQAMCLAIAHRGPDDYGYFIDGNVALGHRRLSIIDLSKAASQPMYNEKKDMVLTYNGEIYNFKELRRTLIKSGHVFRSNSDAEVVLHAYEEWGKEGIKKFNGMFAFAIWDKKNRKLILARDRFGIKPLYYWNNGRTLLFASEIKAFLKYPEFQSGLDLEVLLEYFTFQNIFTHKSFFSGVNIIPPATIMEVSLCGDPSIVFNSYWDFNFGEDKKIKTEEIYVEELNRLFKQAVKRQLVSDVEIGAYLSGGIDSGSITAIASKYFDNLKTFCIGFDLSSASGLELSFDERKKAEHISNLYQTEHHEMVLKSGDMQRCLKRLVWALEDLRLGQCYPNFYASKLAGRFVKVCLSGTGGDELFAGYPWRYYRSLKSRDHEDYIGGYYKYWQRLIPNSVLKKLFAPVWTHVKSVWTEDIFKSIFPNIRVISKNSKDYINHSLYFEAKTFLHGLLILEDKLSMAHSLETRVPFLDNDLADFAMKVPVGLKLNKINEVLNIDEDELAKREKYFKRMRDGKVILRTVLSKYVGDDFALQYKQGFSGPDASWFKGESINYVKGFLLDRRSQIYNFLDFSTASGIINEHLSGKVNRRLFIWSLLCFEWWLRIFLNKENPCE